MGNLPEDPPIVDGLKTVQIKKGDYRKGLVPKQVNCESNCLETCIDPCMFALRLFGQHTSGPYALHLKTSPQCRNAILLSPGVSEFRFPVLG